MAPASVPSKTKLPVVVIKKKKKKPVANNIIKMSTLLLRAPQLQTALLPTGTIRSRGLPASKPLPDHQYNCGSAQQQNAAAASSCDPSFHYECANDDDDDDDDDLLLIANMACDTALAMQSLQQSIETCVQIPLLLGSSGSSSVSRDSAPDDTMIRGVLECQLYEWFSTTQVAANSVSRELDRLLQTNQVRQLASSASSLPHAASAPFIVYLSTADYVRGVYAAAAVGSVSSNVADEERTAAVDWFVRHLKVWTASRIALADVKKAWKADPPVATPAASTAASAKGSLLSSEQNLVRWLQDCQILLAASADHDAYQLWLPGWGGAVLPAFFKAVQDALVYLKQSSYKERSMESIQRRLSRSPIPAKGLLIPWLVAQGHVLRIVRPSGPFLKLIVPK